MRRWIGLAAGIALLWAGAATAAPVKTTFTLVGQTYNLTLPDGYCLPNATTAAVAEKVRAGGEAMLQLHVLYFRCDAAPEQLQADFGAVATPKATLMMVVPARAVLIAQMRASMADGSLAAAIHKYDPIGKANTAIKQATGDDIKMSGDPKVIEVDDQAAYVAGVIGAKVGEQANQVLMVAALTEVKGRMIAWYLYSADTSQASAAALLRWVKLYTADFIAQNGG